MSNSSEVFQLQNSIFIASPYFVSFWGVLLAVHLPFDRFPASWCPYCACHIRCKQDIRPCYAWAFQGIELIQNGLAIQLCSKRERRDATTIWNYDGNQFHEYTVNWMNIWRPLGEQRQIPGHNAGSQIYSGQVVGQCGWRINGCWIVLWLVLDGWPFIHLR